MAIREGRWDCSSCGSTRIYGRHVDCPGCGRPRPAGVRFYLAEGEPVVTDPEQLREAGAGPDWICRHCQASNRAPLARCGGCGAPRGDSPTQHVVPPQRVVPTQSAVEQYWREALAGAPPAPGHGGTEASTPAPEPPASGTPAPRPPRDPFRIARAVWAIPGLRGLLKAAGGIVMAYMLLIGLLHAADRYTYRTQIVPARITELTWERTVWFRELHERTDEGWTLPDSARVLQRERRLQRTEHRLVRVDTTWTAVPLHRTAQDGVDTVTRTVEDRVQTGTRMAVCGTRDLGNGYFEDVECSTPVYETRTRTVQELVPRYTTVPDGTEQRMRLREVHENVPVYATWYRYAAREWRNRYVRARGPSDSARAWPALPSDTLREAEREEHLQVVIRDARGIEHERFVREWEAFTRLRVGQPIALRIGRGSRLGELDLLPRDSLPACRRWHAGKGRPPPDSLGCTPRTVSGGANAPRAPR
jgi:hypothetical protein